jgi:DNA polymerase III delta' subunit
LRRKSEKEWTVISDKVKEQKWALKILKAHIEQNKLASTYLITGSDESGQEELAMAFACALQCEEGKHFKECDCRICHNIQNKNHPDVRWVGESKARSIKIEEIRDLIGWTALKPYEAKRKVFILTGADRLTMEASNALLKTLEEPPGHTIFLLLVENKAQMLETIQSRSFEIRLRPLVEDIKLQPTKGMTFPGAGEQNWEDFLDIYQSVPREELKQNLDALMQHFRDLIFRHSEDPERSEGDGESRSFASLRMTLLESINFTYECKTALDENVNQKLALSRLAMQLRKATVKAAY